MIEEYSNVEKVAEEIKDRLIQIRRSTEKRVTELVLLLEDKEELDRVFDIEHYGTEQDNFVTFSKTYMIELFDQFVSHSNDDFEIMSVAFNFHPKYSGYKLTVRRDLYVREVYEPKHLDKKWGTNVKDKSRGLLNEEKRIIDYLANILAKLVSENEGTLKAVEKVLAKMSNEKSQEGFHIPPLVVASKSTKSPITPPTPDWGDNGGGRPSYTLAQVQGGILGNTIVFNSISDGVIGNEKNFVGVREDDGIHMGADNLWHSNYITIEDKKTYIIRLYVHNNNPNGIRAIAKNVRAAINIPTLSAKQIQVTGFIESSNATPSKYWASVVFRSDGSFFHLEYCNGSARLENNDFGKRFGKVSGIVASDDIVTRASSGGILVAYDTLDGSIPGCHQYANYVTIRVKAVFDEE